jgi:hypothetical protein
VSDNPSTTQVVVDEVQVMALGLEVTVYRVMEEDPV